MADIPLTPLTVILGLILVVIACIGISYCHIEIADREKRRLRKWVADNDFTIVSVERDVFGESPLGIATHSYAPDFRIHVTDSAGNHRKGWVRVGGGFAGTWSRRIKVVWDDGTSVEGTLKERGFSVVQNVTKQDSSQ